MKLSIEKQDLSDYLANQLKVFFPDRIGIRKEEIDSNLDHILYRTEFCFSKVNGKYYKDDNGEVIFNHLNADQYAMFLYFASNTIYRNESDIALCSKIFQLNRYLHGIDAFYEIELPEIFLFVHPLGTVLGRAKYSNYFLVYQRCNVGSNHGIYPTLGEYVSMHPGSSILGKCNIGENCKLSAGALLMDNDLPKDSIYIGNTINCQIKKSEKRTPIWC